MHTDYFGQEIKQGDYLFAVLGQAIFRQKVTWVDENKVLSEDCDKGTAYTREINPQKYVKVDFHNPPNKFCYKGEWYNVADPVYAEVLAFIYKNDKDFKANLDLWSEQFRNIFELEPYSYDRVLHFIAATDWIKRITRKSYW